MTYIAQQRQTVDKLNKEMEQKLIEVLLFGNPVWKLMALSEILMKIVHDTYSWALSHNAFVFCAKETNV